MQDNIRVAKERKYWDKIAPNYDRFVQNNWKCYPSLLEKISQDVDVENTVLEVATGTGLVALRIAERALRVYAVDISSAMLNEAKKKMKEQKISNVEFSIQDAYALTFDNDIFDAVICNNALHNMKYPQKTLSEMRRVLKPEGRLIAAIVCIGESRIFKLIMTIYKLITNFAVFHKLSANESADMIKESGFTIVKKEIIQERNIFPIVYIVAKLDGKEQSKILKE